MRESHSSKDMRVYILIVLSTRVIFSAGEIKDAIERRVTLLPGDRVTPTGRPNELKLRNTVGNALREGAFLRANGLIVRVDHDQFALTQKGREWLTCEQTRPEALIDSLVKWTEENYPGAFG